jgi:hypothetical protein
VSRTAATVAKTQAGTDRALERRASAGVYTCRDEIASGLNVRKPGAKSGLRLRSSVVQFNPTVRVESSPGYTAGQYLDTLPKWQRLLD